jgi:hypothetical protein
MRKFIREINDETLNRVLSKLKWVEGSKIYSSDANLITGCTVPVILKAFEELGKPVELKKMIKNGECYRAILNVEPIEAQDRSVKIKKDPAWKPPAETSTVELPVTEFTWSEFGEMELMIFRIVSKGKWTNINNERYQDGRLVGGWWYAIEDIWGRQFVNVTKDTMRPKKVHIDPSSDGPYYGRVKISDNKTKYEQNLRYLNFYEVEKCDSKDAIRIANDWSSDLHGVRV